MMSFDHGSILQAGILILLSQKGTLSSERLGDLAGDTQTGNDPALLTS